MKIFIYQFIYCGNYICAFELPKASRAKSRSKEFLSKDLTADSGKVMMTLYPIDIADNCFGS